MAKVVTPSNKICTRLSDLSPFWRLFKLLGDDFLRKVAQKLATFWAIFEVGPKLSIFM